MAAAKRVASRHRATERPITEFAPHVVGDGAGHLRCLNCKEKGTVTPPRPRPTSDVYADFAWIGEYNDNVAGFLQRHVRCPEVKRVSALEG